MISDLVLVAYEAMSSLLPLAAAYLVMSRIQRKRGVKVSWRSLALVAVFAVYIAGVFYFTGAGTVWDWLRKGSLNLRNINLLPFSNDIDTVAYGLNIVMFVPLGVLLPLIWRDKNSVSSILVYGAGFSLAIELSQLLNFRCPDIDDLIMNTLGAFVGYALFRAADKFFGFGENGDRFSRFEPLVYIAAMFFGRFFFFNEMWMAGVLYGF